MNRPRAHRIALRDHLSRHMRRASLGLIVPATLLGCLGLAGCAQNDATSPAGTQNQVLLDHMYNPANPVRPRNGRH